MDTTTPTTTSETNPTKVWLRRSAVWRMVQFVLTPMFRIWTPLRAIGLENIDHTSGGILLANHQSFLDPLIVAVRFRRPVSYLARDGLFKVPFVSWILRNTYVLPISQSAFRSGSIRIAVDRLEEGFLVGMFPEGSRSAGDEVARFHPGFLAIVRRSRAPIYPVGIAGADRAMPPGAWFIRPARITVAYGKPFSADECAQLRTGKDDKALAELVRSRVAECQAIAAGRGREADGSDAGRVGDASGGA